MIYTIVGTDLAKREKALKEVSAFGVATAHIYSEQVAMLESFTQASSLFGEKVVVYLMQVMDVAASREELVRLLPDLKDSTNIFIIDEPFADANRVTRLTKYSEKVFDAREAKKKDVDAFTLCTLLAKRDKKALWVEWMNVRDRIESGEAIHGALWWKWTTMWAGVRAGAPAKYSLKECEAIGARLVRAPILAHRGEKDLKLEIEEILLSV